MDTTDASSGKHEIMNWFHVFSFGWLEVLWMNHFFNGLSLRPLTVLSGRRCDWAVYVRLMKWGVDARVSLEKMKLIRPKWSFCHHLLSLMCSNLCEFSSSPKHEDILINVSGCHKSMLFGSQHSFIMFSRRKTLMQRCWNSSVSVFSHWFSMRSGAGGPAGVVMWILTGSQQEHLKPCVYRSSRSLLSPLRWSVFPLEVLLALKLLYFQHGWKCMSSLSSIGLLMAVTFFLLWAFLH